jgi:molybdopterin converting factor small subunit
MKLTVHLLAELKRHAPSNPATVTLPQAATPKDAIEALGLRSGEVWLVTQGGKTIELDQPLRDGDEITLVPPVGGG